MDHFLKLILKKLSLCLKRIFFCFKGIGALFKTGKVLKEVAYAIVRRFLKPELYAF